MISLALLRWVRSSPVISASDAEQHAFRGDARAERHGAAEPGKAAVENVLQHEHDRCGRHVAVALQNSTRVATLVVRHRVVWGESVYVRVDWGVHRINKKKTKTKKR